MPLEYLLCFSASLFGRLLSYLLSSIAPLFSLRETERVYCSVLGYEDGSLYNQGLLIFHQVGSHHQDEEISKIKNKISYTHGQKSCRL